MKLLLQMQGQSPPTAFRGARKGGAEEDGEEADEQEENGGGAPDVMDLLPRTDIRFDFTLIPFFTTLSLLFCIFSNYDGCVIRPAHCCLDRFGSFQLSSVKNPVLL